MTAACAGARTARVSARTARAGGCAARVSARTSRMARVGARTARVARTGGRAARTAARVARTGGCAAGRGTNGCRFLPILAGRLPQPLTRRRGFGGYARGTWDAWGMRDEGGRDAS
jgi:hypothetical protein